MDPTCTDVLIHINTKEHTFYPIAHGKFSNVTKTLENNKSQ